MTEFRDGYFTASSKNSAAMAELVGREYDLALLSSSWDSRCVTICDVAQIKIGTVLLLMPDERDDFGLRDSHDEILRKFCSSISTKCIEISGATYFPEKTWDDIYRVILNSVDISFPVESVLVDLSTTCRFYSLGFIAMLLRLGLTRRIDVLYAECTYEEDKISPTEFTDGTWEKRVIPFLDGIGNPASPEFWLLSCGFEGLKTRRFVKRDEPDQIHLLLPFPGFCSEYADRAKSEADLLIAEFGLTKDDVFAASAADAIEVWKVVSEVEHKWLSEQQISYVCGGTKPHSLGLMLHGLTARRPAVFYIRPDRYKVVRTTITGKYWIYSIEDLSRIPS